MPTPEEMARQIIDQRLVQAGWLVQDKARMNLGAGLEVAVREYQLPAGPCDYLLFVDRRAAGVIEAKPEGRTLTGVTDQSMKYMAALPPQLAAFAPNLLFDYERHRHRDAVPRRARSAGPLAPRLRLPSAGDPARLGERS